MKITPGKYLVIVSVIYLMVASVDFFVRFVDISILPMFYGLALAVPIMVPSLGVKIGLPDWRKR